jgi:hypothetical protein
MQTLDHRNNSRLTPDKIRRASNEISVVEQRTIQIVNFTNIIEYVNFIVIGIRLVEVT